MKIKSLWKQKFDKTQNNLETSFIFLLIIISTPIKHMSQILPLSFISLIMLSSFIMSTVRFTNMLIENFRPVLQSFKPIIHECFNTKVFSSCLLKQETIKAKGSIFSNVIFQPAMIIIVPIIMKSCTTSSYPLPFRCMISWLAWTPTNLPSSNL